MSANPAPSTGNDASKTVWPFERDHPDRVVLEPRAGVAPSDLAPVRIFLGTEEAQYRAERVFFYSIEKYRNPARRYEIFLMKNVSGFDRRHWRTGFTNYRYAIPDFAGGSGRAIYNDVDQIYLADPAELFDLDMAEHGYLAISAKDTSVMLMDCEQMRPMWNRARASTGNKYSLLKRPTRTPGLWGSLDPHWNARDLEYVEGRTKCLHYTALHQQPWQPFPEHYSYHPNSLGYLWHDLERKADEAGYQIFSSDHPSPNFEACVRTAPAQSVAPNEFDSKEIETLWVTVNAGDAALELPQHWTLVDLASVDRSWPLRKFARVLVTQALDHVPPADLGWLLEHCFRCTGGRLDLHTRVQAHRDLGSRIWWADRVRHAARTHPVAEWHLQINDNSPIQASGGIASRSNRRLHRKPRVWILKGPNAGESETACDLVRGLEWPFEFKEPASDGHPGEPGLVLSVQPEHARAAKQIKARSPETVRHVHIGKPRGSALGIDLVLASFVDRMPSRPNVAHLTAPPLAPSKLRAPEAEVQKWQQQFANFPRPIVAILVDNAEPKTPVNHEDLAAAVRSASKLVDTGNGAVIVHMSNLVPRMQAEDFEAALGSLLYHSERANKSAARAFLEIAEHNILVGTDIELLLAAITAGGTTKVISPRYRVAQHTSATRLGQVGHLVFGGGTTYRGTPHQQHWPARLVDSAIVRGWIEPSDDQDALVKALAARGLCTWSGNATAVASPRNLNDLADAQAKIEAMMRSTYSVSW